MPGTGSQSPAGLQPPPNGQPVQQTTQPAAQPAAAPNLSQTLASQTSSSVTAPAASSAAAASAAAAATAAVASGYDTPRSRLLFGPPPGTFGRTLLPTLEDLENSRPSVQGSRARLESLRASLRTARQTSNCSIIRDLAKEVDLTIDTTMLSELFISNTWNIKKVGMMNLALLGIIPVTDKRVEEAATDETEDVEDELHETEYIAGKDLISEKE